jgi:hypothetical protein
LAEDFQVKRKYILAALVGTLALILSSCGTSDKLSTITISDGSSSLANLQGIGGTLQLTVTANYTSGKTVDITNWAVYTAVPDPINNVDDTGLPLASPPATITISATGLLTAVDPAVCTWQNLGTVATPSWFLTGDYKITATYKGFTSQPIFIGVASAAANTGDGTCGP